MAKITYPLQKLFGANASSCINSKFHFTDLFINFLHEVDYKVYQFVFVHSFSMKICYQETDVISLNGEINTKES